MIRDDPTAARQRYPSPDSLARVMLPDMPDNYMVFQTLKDRKTLDITITELKRALVSNARKQAKDEAKLRRETNVAAALGGMPANERDYVELLLSARHYRMTWDRKYYRESKRIDAEVIHNDLHLTASCLELTKPRGDVLGSTNIDRAFAEWSGEERERRLEQIANEIFVLPPHKDAANIAAKWVAWTDHYFVEPDFARAAVEKFIWSVKRFICGLPILQKHMLVLHGDQNTGKSEFLRMLLNAIREIAAETNLQDVLDPRQMDLPQYYALNLDELMFADRADIAALKSFVTGADSARRPMRTNVSQKIDYRATLVATSNKSLDKLIFDSTGMRRFNEVGVKKRKEIEPFWDDIVAFDLQGLWQIVDENSADPVMSNPAFKDRLAQKQEELRNSDSTELWVRQFEFDPNTNYGIRNRTRDHVEYFSQELYQIFRQWEEIFEPSFRGTSHQRWGKDMIAICDNDPKWSYFMLGSKKVYRFDLKTEGTPEYSEAESKLHEAIRKRSTGGALRLA
jgi:hypothetical protein